MAMHLMDDIRIGIQGFCRRRFLKAVSTTAAGVGCLNFRDLMAEEAELLRKRGKSMILLWMQGGPSHRGAGAPAHAPTQSGAQTHQRQMAVRSMTPILFAGDVMPFPTHMPATMGGARASPSWNTPGSLLLEGGPGRPAPKEGANMVSLPGKGRREGGGHGVHRRGSHPGSGDDDVGQYSVDAVDGAAPLPRGGDPRAMHHQQQQQHQQQKKQQLGRGPGIQRRPALEGASSSSSASSSSTAPSSSSSTVPASAARLRRGGDEDEETLEHTDQPQARSRGGGGGGGGGGRQTSLGQGGEASHRSSMLGAPRASASAARGGDSMPRGGEALDGFVVHTLHGLRSGLDAVVSSNQGGTQRVCIACRDEDCDGLRHRPTGKWCLKRLDLEGRGRIKSCMQCGGEHDGGSCKEHPHYTFLRVGGVNVAGRCKVCALPLEMLHGIVFHPFGFGLEEAQGRCLCVRDAFKSILINVWHSTDVWDDMLVATDGRASGVAPGEGDLYSSFLGWLAQPAIAGMGLLNFDIVMCHLLILRDDFGM